MKARIHEAVRSQRHKEDKGFTLIELLVVILVISILAAVAITTYLSGLDSAKKSVSKSTLRTAITIVQGVQAGAGSEDFSGIGTDLPDAVSKLNLTEPDFTFVEGTLTGDNKTNDVGVIDFETNQIVMQTRDGSGHCYFVQYNLGSSTKYGSDTNAGGACPSDPSGGVEYTKNQSVGWKAE